MRQICAAAGKPTFLDALQSVLDLLFDATREHQKDAGQFALMFDYDQHATVEGNSRTSDHKTVWKNMVLDS